MKKKIQELLKHPIIVSFITLGVITPLVGYLKGRLTFAESFSVLWKYISIVFTYRMPVWVIISTIIALILILKLVVLISKNKPEYTTYKKDIIDGVKWEWDWYYSTYENVYDFKSNTPVPYCPNCDGQLVLGKYQQTDFTSFTFHPTEHGLLCHHCKYFKKVADYKDYHQKIKLDIDRRIRTKSFKLDNT